MDDSHWDVAPINCPRFPYLHGWRKNDAVDVDRFVPILGVMNSADPSVEFYAALPRFAEFDE